jgi:uncharacterized protein (DUF305 family)
LNINEKDIDEESSSKKYAILKLEKYRNQVQDEQERKYLNIMDNHQQMAIDFTSEKAQKKLKHIEELIKEVYKNQ